MITRRELLVVLGAALFAPPSTLAQNGKVWHVGFLVLSSRPESLDLHYHGEFSKGMRALGYIEGKNLVIEWRYADGKVERLPGLATELVQLKVDVIVAGNTPPTRAAQKATADIPIVMASVGDRVGSGFVKTLARPGGNITGLSILTGEIGPKLLEMTLAMVPKLSRVAIMINPDNGDNRRVLKSIQSAAQQTKVTIFPHEARDSAEISKAFASMAKQKVGAVIVSNDILFFAQQRQVVELAKKYRFPAITGRKDNVEAGYLMSYGTNLSDSYRRAASYVDKIFKGAKPGDLPVEQPTKFELVINGKTAKALGLKIPQSLLIMSDKVIE